MLTAIAFSELCLAMFPRGTRNRNRIVWRGDSYAAMKRWRGAENNDVGYTFALTGNSLLDALVAETMICVCAMRPTMKISCAITRASRIRPGVGRAQRVIARLEASLQRNPKGGRHAPLCRNPHLLAIRSISTTKVYCQRGQMENLIKLHKAQLASDRTSSHNGQSRAPRAAHRSRLMAVRSDRQSVDLFDAPAQLGLLELAQDGVDRALLQTDVGQYSVIEGAKRQACLPARRPSDKARPGGHQTLGEGCAGRRPV
jgi:hypothetical protein